MSALPLEIYSVATVRDIDRAAIEQAGIPGYTLMSRAGAEAVGEARARFPEARRWQILCGAGNNAGDGYVVARLAASAGIEVGVTSLVDPGSLAGDARTAFEDFAAAGGVAVPWQGALSDDADLIVDALLGSGLDRPVEGDFRAAVAAINAAPTAVLALDVPTGLNADTGAVMGLAVQADLTITFVGLKAGLFMAEGRDHCGELAFADLAIPAECFGDRPCAFRRVTAAHATGLLPKRARTAHKGDFGHVLVIGGGRGMPGAARLCGEAALRSGAGRVTVATHPGHVAAVVAARPELMAHGIEEPADLAPLLERTDVIAVGPGLGQDEWAEGILRAIYEDPRPAVWDADALNWLATAAPATLPAGTVRVYTPHPGEAARLLGVSVGEVQADRSRALRQLAERLGGVIVLKGAGSLVSDAQGVPWLCTAGNPGMAVAGMGDLLTGVIAALLAQGLAGDAAARVGVDAHARAGDRAARRGERGLLASDLFAELQLVLNP